MSSRLSIKPLAPRICPACGQENTFTVLEKRIECRHCGYVIRQPDGHPIAPPSPARSSTKNPTPQNTELETKRPPYEPDQPLKPSYRKTHVGPLDPWASAAFDTGQDHIHRQDWEGAVKAFRRALESQPDFVDAHLWISRIVTDPDLKRDHLTTVLANQPNHLEAVRELMILDGKLAPEAATMDAFQQPEKQAVGGAVGTQTATLRCPTCGSPQLKQDEMTGLLVCDSCGHTMPPPDQRAAEGNLTMALLERRAQPVQWIIGERLLACNSCGSERTIPAQKLSDICPFCGSAHVIQRDVLESFQQPDGLIPFAIKKQQAHELVEDKLGGWMERMKGWFINNMIDRMEVQGVYLPFWMFDATVNVRKTITRKSDQQTGSRYSMTPIPAYQTTEFIDTVYNVPVSGVKSPPPLMTRKIGKYDLGKMIAYEPEMLARYPAEIYTIDFDSASLDARSMVANTLRQKHSALADSNVEVRISPAVQSMSFQLVLLPVWVATIYEKDGDIRPVLVNGQTGNVVLGKAHKPKS